MSLNKLIPSEKIYEDVASPAFKQIGVALGTIVEASKFLIAPFEYATAYRNRWEQYLKRISENVKTENLIEGHPQVVIPTIEGLFLQYENTLLCELFLNLLTNSIDKTKQDLAHPAFPTIIKQLSHDEAVVLFYLKKKSYQLKEKADWIEDQRVFINNVILEEEFPIKKLQYPDNIRLYMNHLYSLNLAGTWETGQEPIYDDENKKQIGVYKNSVRKLNDFGYLFTKSCVPDEFNEL